MMILVPWVEGSRSKTRGKRKRGKQGNRRKRGNECPSTVCGWGAVQKKMDGGAREKGEVLRERGNPSGQNGKKDPKTTRAVTGFKIQKKGAQAKKGKGKVMGNLKNFSIVLWILCGHKRGGFLTSGRESPIDQGKGGNHQVQRGGKKKEKGGGMTLGKKGKNCG